MRRQGCHPCYCAQGTFPLLCSQRQELPPLIVSSDLRRQIFRQFSRQVVRQCHNPYRPPLSRSPCAIMCVKKFQAPVVTLSLHGHPWPTRKSQTHMYKAFAAPPCRIHKRGSLETVFRSAEEHERTSRFLQPPP